MENNPSNPCESVYSKEIMQLAEKYHFPIIADEVYADMAFSGTTFHSIGSFPIKVSVLSVGRISKLFVVAVLYTRLEKYTRARKPA